jgi:hypothetical protein
MIDPCHQIQVFQLHVMRTVDSAAEFVSISGRAAIVDQQHGVAGARQHLEVEGVNVPPAVIVENRGIGRRAERRFQQPPFHLCAVAAVKRQLLDFGLRHTRQPFGIEVG